MILLYSEGYYHLRRSKLFRIKFYTWVILQKGKNLVANYGVSLKSSRDGPVYYGKQSWRGRSKVDNLEKKHYIFIKTVVNDQKEYFLL